MEFRNDLDKKIMLKNTNFNILARRNENDENNAYLHAMVVKSDKEKGKYLV